MIIRSDIHEHLMKTNEFSKVSCNFTVTEKDYLEKRRIVYEKIFEAAIFSL